MRRCIAAVMIGVWALLDPYVIAPSTAPSNEAVAVTAVPKTSRTFSLEKVPAQLDAIVIGRFAGHKSS